MSMYNIDETLEQQDIEKLKNLVEQDIGFSGFELIEKVTVVEKGKETEEMYAGELNGVSFFHEVGGKNWHVRVSEFS